MRKSLFVAIFLATGSLAFGQVGINTRTPQANLDVMASDPSIPANATLPDGFIPPRLTGDLLQTKTTAVPYASAQTGAIVYVTTAPTVVSVQPALAQVTVPGYYFWDGTVWQAYKSSGNLAASAWVLGGNANVGTTNQLGTTDNTPLLVGTGSGATSSFIEAMKFTPSSGTLPADISTKRDMKINGVAVGTGNNSNINNTAVGESALASQDASAFLNVAVGSSSLSVNQFSNNNTAVGANTLNALTGGGINTAIGVQAMGSSTSGSLNVAVGAYALLNNLGAKDNVMVGANTGKDALGGANTFLGSTAGMGNSLGSGNIILGFGSRAGTSSTANVNTVIGFKAGGSLTTGAGNVIVGSIDPFSAQSSSVAIGPGVIDTTSATATPYMYMIPATQSDSAGLTGSNAFVGINNPTPLHALDVRGNGAFSGLTTATGVATTDLTVVADPLTGLLKTLPKALASTAWLLGGNNTASLQNLGTTSPQPMAIVTNGAAAINIDASQNVSTPNDATINGVLVGNGGLNNNTVVGAVFNNSKTAIGQYNVFVGYNLGNKGVSTSGNTIVGAYSAYNNNTGGYNTYLGLNVGQLNTGKGNIMIGVGAGAMNSSGASTGGSNILLGNYAGATLTTGSGNVIIGNLSPLATDSNTVVIGTGGDTARVSDAYFPPTAGIEYMRMVMGDGTAAAPKASVGIGMIPNSAYALNVAGSVISTTGSYATSDRRLKTNIKNLTAGTDVLMQLRPVIYDKKTSLSATNYPIKNEMGFIAQEIRNVLPNVVKEDGSKDKLLAVDYTALIPVLTKAFQEQEATIKAQQKEIDELKKLVKQLAKK